MITASDSPTLSPLLLSVSAVQTVVQGASPAAGLIQTVEGGVVTKRSSRIAGMSRKETEGRRSCCFGTLLAIQL